MTAVPGGRRCGTFSQRELVARRPQQRPAAGLTIQLKSDIHSSSHISIHFQSASVETLGCPPGRGRGAVAVIWPIGKVSVKNYSSHWNCVLAHIAILKPRARHCRLPACRPGCENVNTKNCTTRVPEGSVPTRLQHGLLVPDPGQEEGSGSGGEDSQQAGSGDFGYSTYSLAVCFLLVGRPATTTTTATTITSISSTSRTTTTTTTLRPASRPLSAVSRPGTPLDRSRPGASLAQLPWLKWLATNSRLTTQRPATTTRFRINKDEDPYAVPLQGKLSSVRYEVGSSAVVYLMIFCCNLLLAPSSTTTTTTTTPTTSRPSPAVTSSVSLWTWWTPRPAENKTEPPATPALRSPSTPAPTTRPPRPARPWEDRPTGKPGGEKTINSASSELETEAPGLGIERNESGKIPGAAVPVEMDGSGAELKQSHTDDAHKTLKESFKYLFFKHF